MISLKHSPDQSANEVTFVLGNIHDQIGGPVRTIWGYTTGLASKGINCIVAGLGSHDDIEKNFALAHSKLVPIGGPAIKQLWKLLSLYRAANSRSSIVIVGVWHLPFFVLGALHALTRLYPKSGRRSVILVPTMSLTDYDWAKHARAKKILRPFVSLIVRGLDGVVFASSGEREMSSPAVWRNSSVILHPTISVGHEPAASQGDRDIDVLFVGRIDPQKDIKLLLKSFSLISSVATLHLVGDGESGYISELKKFAASLGVSDRVTWHGWKSHTECLDMMQRTKVVAVTSVVENFCHVAVESIVGGCDLVLVNRVMSAVDFSILADIDVVEPFPEAVARGLESRLDSWADRIGNRTASAVAVRDSCSPQSAATSLSRFIRTSVGEL